QGESFEHLVFKGESAGQSDWRDVFICRGEHVQVLAEHGMNLNLRNAPLVHHAPGAHSCAPPAASAVSRSISASEANFAARAISPGRYAPVFSVMYLAPALRGSSTRLRNASFVTILTRECRSNS